MLVILSFIFLICFAICGITSVKLAQSILAGRKDIFITHLITIMKYRRYQPSPLLLYISEAVCLRWLYHHMLSVSYIYIYICIYNRVHYRLTVEGIDSEILIGYILPNVCLRLNHLSVLSCNIWGCELSAYPFILWWLWECVDFILLSPSNRTYDQFAIVYQNQQWLPLMSCICIPRPQWPNTMGQIPYRTIKSHGGWKCPARKRKQHRSRIW